MLTLSYNNLRRLGNTAPICPKPKAVGLENIPKDGPIIYVYNHRTKGGEPIYFGLAAPSEPNIKFLAEITIANPEYLPTLRKDIEDAIFPQGFQKMVKKSPAKLSYAKLIDYPPRYVNAQIKRIGVIIVDLYEPATKEESLKKFRTNKQALKECIKSLENDIPIAIAPSGGKTHKTVENPVYNPIVPTLASRLYKQGKVVKIVPSVVKERPMINKETYLRYVGDRIFGWLMNLFKINSYEKPCLTVEFLPPLTFENAKPSKPEKTEFVKNLQQIIYNTLEEE